MSLNEDQVRALASLAEALKGTTIEELIKSNTGLKPSDEVSSSSALQDLKDTTTPTSGITALLALHSDVHITRDVNTAGSQFVPSFGKMMFTLNSMDYHVSNNFYARRAMPQFFPTLTRLYMSIIGIIQTIRVMKHARTISPADAAFLEDFLEMYPAETLPVPGPLLPFMKSLCISYPENANLRRVHPALPRGYPLLPRSAQDPTLTGYDLQNRFYNTNHIDYLIPFPAYIAHLHHRLTDTHPGHTYTFGADDSDNAGTATRTAVATPDPAYPMIVDLLTHPKKQVRQNYFPFVTRASSAPNGSTDVTTTKYVDIFGTRIVGPISGATNAQRSSLTKLGINEPIRINYDLIPQFKKAFSGIDIPEPQLDDEYESIAEVLLLDADMEWFGKLAAMMAAYSRFFPDSGTLADASLEGPRIGQYIANIQPAVPALALPSFPQDPKANMKYTLQLQTSVSKAETIIEMTAAYTCTNIDAQNVHPYLPGLGHTGTRTGPFWDNVPVYNVSTTDTAWIKLDQAIQRQVVDRPKDA